MYIKLKIWYLNKLVKYRCPFKKIGCKFCHEQTDIFNPFQKNPKENINADGSNDEWRGSDD